MIEFQDITDEESEQNENTPQEISSDSSSPSKKKRKRESPVKVNASSLDDGSMCNICFESFGAVGQHRIVSLKCGHIFGQSCISIWVKDNKNCPQCKGRATTRDFRNIFACKIVVVDNAREAELEIEIKKLQGEMSKLVATNISNSTTVALQRRQIQELEKEIQRLKSCTRKNSDTACIQAIKSGRMFLEKNIDFRDGSECKLISFMTKNKKLLVSQKLNSISLFSGYGLRFVDVQTHRCEKFINTGNKIIYDFSFDSSESYVVSASKENTCKVFNISTCQSIATFAPLTTGSSQIWCCAFNKNRDNEVIFGVQNGGTYIYDLRRSSEVLHTLELLDNKMPVKHIIPINKNELFPLGGFFVFHCRGLYFYEYKDGLTYAMTKLNFEESVHTATYEEKTEMILIQTANFDQSYYILARLVRIDEIPVLQEVYRIKNVMVTHTIPPFSRPTQIKVPDGFIVACYNDDVKELQTYTPSIGKIHSIAMQNVVSDITPIYTEHTPVVFAALSASRLRIYKVNLEYR